MTGWLIFSCSLGSLYKSTRFILRLKNSMALIQGAAGRSSSSPSRDVDTGKRVRSSPRGPAVFTNKTRGGVTGWGFRRVHTGALRAELPKGEQEDSEDAIGCCGSTTEAYGEMLLQDKVHQGSDLVYNEK